MASHLFSYLPVLVYHLEDQSINKAALFDFVSGCVDHKFD